MAENPFSICACSVEGCGEHCNLITHEQFVSFLNAPNMPKLVSGQTNRLFHVPLDSDDDRFAREKKVLQDCILLFLTGAVYLEICKFEIEQLQAITEDIDPSLIPKKTYQRNLFSNELWKLQYQCHRLAQLLSGPLTSKYSRAISFLDDVIGQTQKSMADVIDCGKQLIPSGKIWLTGPLSSDALVRLDKIQDYQSLLLTPAHRPEITRHYYGINKNPFGMSKAWALRNRSAGAFIAVNDNGEISLKDTDYSQSDVPVLITPALTPTGESSIDKAGLYAYIQCCINGWFISVVETKANSGVGSSVAVHATQHVMEATVWQLQDVDGAVVFRSSSHSPAVYLSVAKGVLTTTEVVEDTCWFEVKATPKPGGAPVRAAPAPTYVPSDSLHSLSMDDTSGAPASVSTDHSQPASLFFVVPDATVSPTASVDLYDPPSVFPGVMSFDSQDDLNVAASPTNPTLARAPRLAPVPSSPSASADHIDHADHPDHGLDYGSDREDNDEDDIFRAVGDSKTVANHTIEGDHTTHQLNGLKDVEHVIDVDHKHLAAPTANFSIHVDDMLDGYSSLLAGHPVADAAPTPPLSPDAAEQAATTAAVAAAATAALPASEHVDSPEHVPEHMAVDEVIARVHATAAAVADAEVIAAVAEAPVTVTAAVDGSETEAASVSVSVESAHAASVLSEEDPSHHHSAAAVKIQSIARRNSASSRVEQIKTVGSPKKGEFFSLSPPEPDETATSAATSAAAAAAEAAHTLQAAEAAAKASLAAAVTKAASVDEEELAPAEVAVVAHPPPPPPPPPASAIAGATPESVLPTPPASPAKVVAVASPAAAPASPPAAAPAGPPAALASPPAAAKLIPPPSPPVAAAEGSGDKPDTYRWSETKDAVEVVYSIPDGMSPKSITVKFTSKSVEVRAKVTGEMLLRLNLNSVGGIIVDGCAWTCQGRNLDITLEKAVSGVLWKELHVE